MRKCIRCGAEMVEDCDVRFSRKFPLPLPNFTCTPCRTRGRGR